MEKQLVEVTGYIFNGQIKSYLNSPVITGQCF